METAKNQLLHILSPYLGRIETIISSSIESLGEKTALRDSYEYALKNGGKRFRPALVFFMAEAVGKKKDVSHAALAVELFHTASLIADDLPCMDDELERRKRPTVHKVFGEATALLATYSMISEGYERLRLNASEPEQLSLALYHATRTTGINGATGGQFFDLYPPSLTEQGLREIIRLKTGALFELSFLLGWIFGGGDLHQVEHVKKAAAHFGMAFQIVDDLDDLEQDLAQGKLQNYAALTGVSHTLKILENEIAAFLTEKEKLRIVSPELDALTHFLTSALDHSTAASSSS